MSKSLVQMGLFVMDVIVPLLLLMFQPFREPAGKRYPSRP